MEGLLPIFNLFTKINMIMDSEAVRCSCKSVCKRFKTELYENKERHLYSFRNWMCKPQILVKLLCVTLHRKYLCELSQLFFEITHYWHDLLYYLKLCPEEVHLRNKNWKETCINTGNSMHLLLNIFQNGTVP